ncbi:BofC C-terminal domain-containing protein [Paenibacillus xanthanilyticus]|uniref:BofC C-terminal domain-containing protein n=1 Tax=Paenibacillus xanthanilyticus TaxID=1783531 RepID=A0ABV8JZ31_9BACL
MEFSLWKQLKKRLRRRGRPSWQLGCLLAAVIAFGASSQAAQACAAEMPSSETWFDPQSDHRGTAGVRLQSRSVIETLSNQAGDHTVELRRVYLCGDEREALGTMGSQQVLGLMRQHPQWTALLEPDGQVVMEEMIDDLSDACKKTATFSMDKTGRLSLFDGPPKKEKVLRTFFQLDVNFMESSLPREQLDQLTAGIRVTDKDEYNSVLSTFSDYATDRSEKVMKRTY